MNRQPHSTKTHGHERTDEYFWLRDRENPEVIAWLENENARTDRAMEHTRPLQESIYNEIKGRIKKNDTTAPYRLRDYYYYTRYEEELEYGIHCRKKIADDAVEEIILDSNLEAAGKAYFCARGLLISTDQNILAYALDFTGSRTFTIYFKNLATGEIYPDQLQQSNGDLTWANDNKTIFYTRFDPETLRPNKIYKHVLGDHPDNDVLVYHEEDVTYNAWLSKSKSRRYIFINSSQTLTTEYRFLDADNPNGELQLFHPRERGHEYNVDHLGEFFYISSNENAQNFKICRAHQDHYGHDHWQEILSHRESHHIDNFELFDRYLVTEERAEGLTHLHVIPLDGTAAHYISFEEPAYLSYLGTNPEADTDVLRFGYTSLNTPSSVYHYHMASRERTLIKRQEVSNYNHDDYATERLYAIGHDGIKIPISLVYRKDKRDPAGNPLLVYGYGAYGCSIDPTFSSARLSLLDRGFIFAIAHIRGGQILGRKWYDDGKVLNKMNTFQDFISCTKHLRDTKYAHPKHIYAKGGSAGGLLMGAVINMENELFNGVVAQVPFVDVLNTMLDSSLPLTTNEYDEWGNPEQEDHYHYILQYSPYDNVKAQNYPHLLVTTGLNDTLVHYWEPAKWVARLRDKKTDNNMLLLKTDMDVGHGGSSGRFKQINDTTLVYAFLLNLAGKVS